jgi:hypothetical protein
VVHDEDRIVLVEPARQRIVERAADDGGTLLVRDPADEFDASRMVGTVKASAKFLSSIGNSPTCATKVKCVSAEPVATTLAPVT